MFSKKKAKRKNNGFHPVKNWKNYRDTTQKKFEAASQNFKDGKTKPVETDWILKIGIIAISIGGLITLVGWLF